uniref:60S ribosomal protein L11-like n=1 Tax=Elaeis guineensis var. tenera TaxID=51953 RepID=A0A6I9RDS7_ELAGV|nr:60S ribosomal protein L11-like [Elaeis guineensis]
MEAKIFDFLFVHCYDYDHDQVQERLSGRTPVFSKDKLSAAFQHLYIVRSLHNENIACYVTVRGDKAKPLSESDLKVKEYELLRRSSSRSGCFSLGIQDNIDLGSCLSLSIH